MVQDPENKENDACDLIQGKTSPSFKEDNENHPPPTDSLPAILEPAKTSSGSDASKYEAIASLDAGPENEEEKWSDRTAVITKIEHEDYTAYAQDILIDILKDVKTPTKGWVTHWFSSGPGRTKTLFLILRGKATCVKSDGLGL